MAAARLSWAGVAQLVLDMAEEAREAQFRGWKVKAEPWSPRCRIYFYPTAEVMRRMTAGTTRHGSAQAPASRFVKGQLRFRRINLTADDRGIPSSRTAPTSPRCGRISTYRSSSS